MELHYFIMENNNNISAAEPNSTTLTISLPLEIYLEDIGMFSIRNLDNGIVVSRAKGELIKSIDQQETLCHVELPEDRLKVAHIYAIKDWRDSVERRVKQKRQSEFERRDKDFKQDQIAKIVEKLCNHPLGSLMLEEQRLFIAKKIVDEGNLVMAKQFGVEELTYKGEIKI